MPNPIYKNINILDLLYNIAIPSNLVDIKVQIRLPVDAISATVPSGRQWSVSNALSGCWSASCRFFKGTTGVALGRFRSLPNGPHNFFRIFFFGACFKGPFLEPKSPTCVKMAPKSDPKVIQNLTFCRPWKPHSDMAVTDREPHWPAQGRFQKPSKKQVLKKNTKLAKCWNMCQKVTRLGDPGAANEPRFASLFLSWGALGTKMAPRPSPRAPRTAPSADFR